MAYTLGPNDMLIHLCQHGTYFLEPLKLIWCADIIGVVDRFVEKIDWDWFRQHLPWVLPTVAMFGCLVPPSDAVQEQMGAKSRPAPRTLEKISTGGPEFLGRD